MVKKAKKLLLPRLALTKTVEPSSIGASRVDLPADFSVERYFVRRDQDTPNAEFNLFPVILGTAGEPWAEACAYLASRISTAIHPAMSTYSAIADDLVAFRRFLDDEAVDWTAFPLNKLSRPTYRFSAYLRLSVAAGELSASTAKRRMGSIIAFYKWLIEEDALQLPNAPWRASDRYIQLKDLKGIGYSKRVVTTDLSINFPRQDDPYDRTIDDGGKLRPLTLEEQGWVMESLLAHGNTEMTLIHLLALSCGARIQTILTIRVRHVMRSVDGMSGAEVRLPVGPGTNVDTKNDKRLVLHIPVWLYRMLRTYALSERANQRRQRSAEKSDPYLFLSVRGAPLYAGKRESMKFNQSNRLRHAKVGQAVRQVMAERIIPHIRKKNDPSFVYRFHDLRASYGMNLTDQQLALVAKGEITLHRAREFVKARMGHESAITTDRYLQYRSKLKLVRQVADDYSSHLRSLSEAVMKEVL